MTRRDRPIPLPAVRSDRGRRRRAPACARPACSACALDDGRRTTSRTTTRRCPARRTGSSRSSHPNTTGRPTWPKQERTRRLVTLDVVGVPADGGDEVAARCRERLGALMRWVHSGVPRVIDGRRSPSGDFCVVVALRQRPAPRPLLRRRHVDAASLRARLFSPICATIVERAPAAASATAGCGPTW